MKPCVEQTGPLEVLAFAAVILLLLSLFLALVVYFVKKIDP